MADDIQSPPDGSDIAHRDGAMMPPAPPSWPPLDFLEASARYVEGWMKYLRDEAREGRDNPDLKNYAQLQPLLDAITRCVEAFYPGQSVYSDKYWDDFFAAYLAAPICEDPSHHRALELMRQPEEEPPHAIERGG